MSPKNSSTTHHYSFEAGPRFNRGWDHLAIANQLDREADVELAHGHHLRAEYLARHAHSLREREQ
ncbi:hypothetical protein [Acidisoma sp. S159]|uniref:hypothetical protein n=1 Tax=Acidisoma sp. S159 TaxID=1747225 RepID=UPI00131E8481|nr:hypothetical protein [Acidisoma sp. S159]